MKKKIFSICFSLLVLLSIPTFAQGPGEPYHPMTANGAKHIHYINNQYFAHKLFWKNPTNTIYNDIYISQDSNLVINLDTTALILSGHDSSKVFNTISLELLGTLDIHKKYYWRIVEYNSSGFTAGPIWYFMSASWGAHWVDYFDDDLSNYTIQPPGANWLISNGSSAGGQPPELVYFDLTPIGTSYLILNDYFDISPDINSLSFKYGVILLTEFTIGIAYSLDEGINWVPVWQQVVTGNIPPTQVNSVPIPNENYVKLALFCTSTVAAGFWYVDDLILSSPLTIPAEPPAQIQALADSLSLKVFLNWSPGWGIDPISGYRIQRKEGLPTSSSEYQTIIDLGPYELSFEDSTVQLSTDYTYRIQTLLGWGGVTTWSNEATAYVPNIVPVELQSLIAEVIGSDVKLLWSTATETNNQGFDVEKKALSFGEGLGEAWDKVGFVPGYGTTTEVHHYSYTDESIQSGKYQYRLKQIDFDGLFEYSNIVEVTVAAPTKFSLEQNYPNPFNPTTKIKYTIPSVETTRRVVFTTLKVYDVLGNEVATLVNEEKPAGTYEVEFNRTELPSGIYFYQLKTGSFVETKKMILIK